ncbi:hydroxyethylthiazole kinase [Methanoculleus bovis]|jgi:hydroxyethylthiazole kinase
MPVNTTKDSSINLMDGAIPAGLLASVRERRPLVHHITNSVTINDCANITICVGAAPVMAEAPEEVAEMVAAAGALVLNIGTLSAVQVDAMLIAGRRANELGIPVVLDPVGAGATGFRTETARRLLDSLDVAVLKGNAGEIGVLAGTGGSVRGVDSGGIAGDPVETARECARSTGTVVAMTGEVDVVADGRRVFLVGNGNPMMDRLSGTGCMAASVTGAFAAVADDYAVASAAALAAFGRAGERAAAGARGPYSFRTALFDELSRLTPSDLAEHARVEAPYGV